MKVLYFTTFLLVLGYLVGNTRRLFTFTYLAYGNFFLYCLAKPYLVDVDHYLLGRLFHYIIALIVLFTMGVVAAKNFVPPAPREEIDLSSPLQNVYGIMIACLVLVLLQLAMVGVSPLSAVNDPISARWALGHHGNILFQSLWVNFILVSALYVAFSQARLHAKVLSILGCLSPFLLLSIRAPVVDFAFSLLAMRALKRGRSGIGVVPVLAFAVPTFLFISVLGIWRLSTQVGQDVEALVDSGGGTLPLMWSLILQRLDYLDVLLAAEPDLRSLRFPALPLVYNLLPRALVPDKLYSSDTQVTAIAGVGFDEENITRVVGIVAEMMSGLGGLVFGILFAVSMGFAFAYLDRRPASSRGTAVLFARLLPAAGALPLLGGWNTLYFSSLLLNVLFTLLSVAFYENLLRVRPVAGT
jgi:hypothetical protein